MAKNRRIGILTGGGDVPPLNAVIAAAGRACTERGVELLGFVRGWQGVIENRWLSLSGVHIDQSIGGTILKSSRIRLDGIGRGIERAMQALHDRNLDGLIVIGGEDTLSNCFSLPDFPMVLISKTIDNDVGRIEAGGADILNYFTLGFPTAARRITSFASLREGLRTTAYSHERIIVIESMGMHAGWLALASSMGHPDFIIIPEFPLNYERFKSLAIEKYKGQKHLIIVVAEGARFSNGSYLSADEDERDDFGHPRFRGSAEALATRLRHDLRGEFAARNVNAVNPSYLYRSGLACPLDMKWARKLGREAVNLLSDGLEVPVFLAIQSGEEDFFLMPCPLSGIGNIDEIHRFVDQRFYDPDAFEVTAEGRKYLKAMLEEIPLGEYGIRLFPPA
jgi:6-phosphofructokinase 1